MTGSDVRADPPQTFGVGTLIRPIRSRAWVRAVALASAFCVGNAAAWAIVPSLAISLAAGMAGSIALVFLAKTRAPLVSSPKDAPGRALTDRGSPTPAESVIGKVIGWRQSHDGFPPLGLSALAILAAVVLIGFASAALRVRAVIEDPIRTFDASTVPIEGILTSDPQPSGPHSDRFSMKTSFVSGRAIRSRISVRVSPSAGDLIAGERVELIGKVSANDLADALAASSLHRGEAARVFATRPSIIKRPGANTALRSAARFRNRVSRAYRRVLGRERGGLLAGLVLGDTRSISQRTIDRFRITGLSHLIAVSGANLAMVIGALYLLLRAARVHKRVQVFISLVVVVLFTFVTGAEPSILRAALMLSLALAAILMGRRSDAINSLAVAFTALIAIDPFIMWSIGFQLSFAATFGILLLSAPLVRHIRRTVRFPAPFAEATAVSIAAQLGVTPLLVFHFGRLSLVSIPANLAAFPLVGPATVAGLIGATADGVSHALAKPFVVIAGWFVTPLLWLARVFASVPSSSVQVRSNNVFGLVLAYVAILAFGLFIYGKTKAARWSLAACLIAVVLARVIPIASASPPTGLRVTFFDVGQGDAALVESPSGARLLVDGGPEGGAASQKLSAKGIRSIDAAFFSHGHMDHVSGLVEVVDKLRVGEVIYPGVPNRYIGSIGRTSKVEAAGEGDRFRIGDIEVEVLGPSNLLRELATDQALSQGGESSYVNEASLVLRVGWARGCVLFVGDIQEEAQMALVRDHAQAIHCSVLKAPHHGSAHLMEDFVSAVDADVVSVSVGPNPYGLPAQSALRKLVGSGAHVVRTDREGDIVVELNDQGDVAMR